MPRVITETDLGTIQIVITQDAAGANPTVVVTAVTTNDSAGAIPGRTTATAEVYSLLGSSAQTLVKSICSSIRNRTKTVEGI